MTTIIQHDRDDGVDNDEHNEDDNDNDNDLDDDLNEDDNEQDYQRWQDETRRQDTTLRGED